MRNVKAITPLVAALVIALGASYYIYQWLQKRTVVVEKPAAQDTVQVAVATVDLAWGTQLTKEMVTLAGFPRQSVPSGSYSSAEPLIGRVLVSPLKEKEPIMGHKLAPDSIKTGGVAAVITPGKRAVAVAGDKVIGLGGFIQPGNRVDVLVTIKSKEAEAEQQVTKIVLEDILVLATGTVVERKGNNEPAPVDVFTLEVAPEEAERLSLAATQGRLQFALRNIMDKETVYTMGATVSDTLDAYRPRLQLVSGPALTSIPIPEVGKEMRKPTHNMRIIRGSSASEVSF